MNPNIDVKSPALLDGWVPGCFSWNRAKFPLEQLTPYEGKYVAWSLDGTQIIGSAESQEELWDAMDRLGFASTSYVVSWIDPPL